MATHPKPFLNMLIIRRWLYGGLSEITVAYITIS
jgi:hypothetical protein